MHIFWPSSCLNLWMTHGPSTSCSMGPTVSAFIAASVTWGWRSLWEWHLSEILSNKWTSKRSCQLSMGSGSMKHWAQHGSEEGTPERNVMRPYSQISLLAKRQHPEYLRKQGWAWFISKLPRQMCLPCGGLHLLYSLDLWCLFCLLDASSSTRAIVESRRGVWAIQHPCAPPYTSSSPASQQSSLKQGKTDRTCV